MTTEATPTPKTKTQAADRTPIRVAKIIISHPNPYGVNMPHGVEGNGEKIQGRVLAGEEGGVKTEIDFMPWMRSFRVRRSIRVTRTEKKDGKDVEVASWRPMGQPFHIPEVWCVWVAAEEA